MSDRRRMLLAIVNQFKWLPCSYTYLYHSLVPQTLPKNLFNGQWEVGSLSYQGTNENDNRRIRSVDYISVNGGNVYNLYCSNIPNFAVYMICEYDSSKTFIQRNLSYSQTTYSITLQANTKYVRICVGSSTDYPFADTTPNIQFYSKSLNVRNKAKFTKIYGNSEVVNQWFNPSQSANQNGITLTNNNDGSITLSGIASANAYLKFQGLIDVKANDVCLFFSNHNDITGVAIGLDGGNTYWNNLSGEIKTISNSQQCFPSVRVLSGTDLSTPITIYPQMVKLTQQYPFDTPTTLTDNRIQNMLLQAYIPYNTGEIKDMEIGEFSSEDSNNQPLGTLQLPALYKSSGIGTSKDSWEITSTSHVFTRNNFYYTFTGNESKSVINTDSQTGYITLYIAIPYTSITGNNVICDICQPAPYNSYNYTNPYYCYMATGQYFETNLAETTDTATMAKLVGKSIRFKLATPQVITIPRKHLAVVDLGSLSWLYDGVRFSASVSDIKNVNARTNDIYCEDYMTDTGSYDASKTGIIYHFQNVIYIQDSRYTNATDFKNAMQGVYLFYETENEVADITDTFDIEAGGSVNGNLFSWVRNQLVVNGNFATNTDWTKRYGTTGSSSVSNNVLTLTFGGDSNNSFQIYQLRDFVSGHKYLVSCDYNVSSVYIPVYLRVYQTPLLSVNKVPTANTWEKLSAIFDLTQSGNFEYGLYYVSSSIQNGDTMKFRNFIIVDLTLAFGAGNEPTSINDYRIQYILEHGYIPTDTSGTYTNETCEVLPNVDFKFKCK